MPQTGVSLSGFVWSNLTVITVDLNNYVAAVYLIFLHLLTTFLQRSHKLSKGALHDGQCELQMFVIL